MFKTLEYKQHFSHDFQFLYELEDTDFGIIQTKVGFRRSDAVAGAAIIVREYSERELNVGKNLALFVMHCARASSDTRLQFMIESICLTQDIICPAYVHNWNDYIQPRNEYIERMTLLK